MNIKSTICVLTWTLIAMNSSHIEGLAGTCDSQSIFCFANGYKPLNIYSTSKTSDLTLCLEKCVDDNVCKVFAYNEQVFYLFIFNLIFIFLFFFVLLSYCLILVLLCYYYCLIIVLLLLLLLLLLSYYCLIIEYILIRILSY